MVEPYQQNLRPKVLVAPSAVRHLDTRLNRDREIHRISDETEFVGLFVEMLG
jgi:hypothetical protein